MNYTDCEKIIYNIPKFNDAAGPEVVHDILTKLINEEELPPVIHVAGTNGKGSVCAFIKNIMMDAGYNVGFFISPHLVSMRERICINDEMISENDFVDAYLTVKNALEKMSKDENISYFAILFLMAMVYFDKQKPDYIILETGLGGRLDATNSLQKKELCVITEIGLDHTAYLGNTFAEIAAEKAGILKKGVKAVFCDKRRESTEVFVKAAETLKCNYVLINDKNTLNVKMDNGLSYEYHKKDISYKNIKIDTVAGYQVENSALAITAIELLGDRHIKEKNIRNGIFNTHWAGRMQKISKNIYIDGAHNEDGISAFLHSVENISKDKKNYLIFGVMSDKAYVDIIARIANSKLFDTVCVVEVDTDRSLNIEKNREQWEKYNSIKKIYCENVVKALNMLKAEKRPDEYIYIAGSLYMIGELLGQKKYE